MKVSIIVPAYNRPEGLKTCIQALLEQEGLAEAPEIIIVDDGSDVPANAPRGVRLLRQNNRGPAGARNTGVNAALGELILFTDDDCIPARDWASLLVAWMEGHPDMDGVSGKVVNRHSRNRYARVNQKIIDGLRNVDLGTGDPVPFATTNNIAYRARVFSDGIRFDTGFHSPGGEERELHWRLSQLGYRLGFCEEGVVLHDHAPSMVGYVRQQMAYGGGAARLDRLHGAPGDIRLVDLLGVAASVVVERPTDLPVLVLGQVAVAAGRLRERALTRLRGRP